MIEIVHMVLILSALFVMVLAVTRTLFIERELRKLRKEYLDKINEYEVLSRTCRGIIDENQQSMYYENQQSNQPVPDVGSPFWKTKG